VVRARLFVLTGPDVGKSFELAHGARAGRSPECEIVLRHASISRRHAHFERAGDEWFVVDDGSRNGVHVGERRVERAKLSDAQEFRLGELELRFRALEDEVAGAAPARAPEVARAAPAAVAPSAPADDDGDEIVLEGGDEPEPPRPAPARSPEPHQEPAIGARVGAPDAATEFSRRTPPPLAQSIPSDTGFGAASSRSAGASISRGPRGPGDRVLQFHKVEAKSGLANADLAQLSAPIKLALVLLAVVVLAGAAWLAFSGAAWLKKGIGGSAEAEQVETQQ
jgi:hypothetical protein